MRMGIHTVCQLTFAVMLTALLCLGSVVRPSVAHATVYYVATTGNDTNSCSTAQNISTPKRHILGASGGLACLTAGDTLYIRQGTYTENGNWPEETTVPSGTSWANAITIAGYPGEVVTLPNGINIQDNFDASVAAYLILDNFITPDYRVAGNAHHIRVSNSTLTGGDLTTNVVMVMQNAAYNEFLHNDVCCALADASGSAYGFYVSTHDNLFEGNIIHDNTGSGLILYHSGSSNVSNNIVRNNIFYRNAYDDGGRDNDNDTLLLASGNNNQAYNNILYGNGNPNHITKCYGCGGGGLSTGYGCTNCTIYNNTIYGNVGVGLAISNAPNTQLTNNITFGNGIDRIVDWGGSAGSTSTTNLCGDNTGMSCILTTDPQFVNAAGHDFHLQAGSPAIDAGTTVSVVTTDIAGVSRPQGSAYDIGAREY